MLKSLHLRNFQTHRNLSIPFENITTIIGPSDSGKSAIIRALQLVLLNRPTGDAFITKGKKLCQVKATFDDCPTIIRTKGRKNEYRLGDERYVAFGTKVPEVISDAVRVSEDNFQCQHDPPYWLSLSAGQAARELNSIVNLEAIDRTQREVKRRLQAEANYVRTAQVRLREAKERKRGLAWLDEFGAELDALHTLEARIASNRAEIARMALLVDNAKTYKAKIRRAHKGDTELERLSQLATTIRDKRSGQKTLRALLESARRLRKATLWQDEKLHEAEDNLEKQMNGRCPLCGGILTG